MLFGTLNENPGDPPRVSNRGQFPADVRGPGDISGYFLREPGSNWPIRKMEHTRKKTGAFMDLQRTDDKNLSNNSFYNEFLDKTEPKMVRSYIELLARVGSKAVERNLKRRQAALKELLLQDELRWSCMEHELKSQQMTDRFAEAKRYTQEVRAQHEAERQEYVQKKRDLQFRLNTQNVRTLTSQKITADCKAVNLGQIRDKRDRQEADREEQRLFAELNNKILEAQYAREEEDARKKYAGQIITKDSLKAQIAYKAQLTERERMDQLCLESERIRLLQDNLLDEQKRLRELKKREQEELRKLTEEQVALRRRYLAEEADREAADDEARIRAAKELVENEEEEKLKNKVAARLEQSMYLNYLENLRKEREMDEKVTDEMIEELAKKSQRKVDLRRCKEMEANRQLIAKTLEERARQVKEREEMRNWEAEIKKDEIAEDNRLLKCQQELREKYELRKRQEKLIYRSDLQNQMCYNDLLRKRRDEERQRMWEHCLEEEKKFNRRVAEICKDPFAGAKHPFRYHIERTVPSS